MGASEGEYPVSILPDMGCEECTIISQVFA
jgi:hypothetical protein